MAKRGGSGKASFQALCTPPDPSSVSFAAFEKELLDVKAHLMALRPAKFFVAEEFVATAFFITIFSFLFCDGACPLLTYYSSAHSRKAFSGPKARSPPSPTHAPLSHPRQVRHAAQRAQ
jgi:hypothetical protein